MRFTLCRFAILCAGVALIAGATGATAADEAVEKIVFTTQPRDGKKPRGIAVMNADGTGRKVLTPDDTEEDQPALSADGKRITFRRGLEVWTMNSDGSGRKDIAWRDKGVTSPAWSPDGKRIAYFGYGKSSGGPAFGSRETELMVVDADGKNRITLGKGKDGGGFLGPSPKAAWSPDGRRVLWGGPKLHVVDADGNNDRVLDDWWANDMAWSPDGKKIAFTPHVGGGSPDIFVMDADGNNKKPLIKTPLGRAAWSPDGKRITYVGGTKAGDRTHADLYVCSADGSGPTRLTNFGDAGGDPSGISGPWLDHPRWSADGKRILFNRMFSDKKKGTAVSICVIDADGKNYKELTPSDEFDVLGDDATWFALPFLPPFQK